MSMSQRIIRPRVLEENRAWIHRDFLSDKLRARERYWRFLSSQEVLTSGPFLHQKSLDDDGGGDDSYWIIPDGLTWRKYLPLLTQLVERTSKCRFLLLESAVECLDYRNSSPCMTVEDEDGKPVFISETSTVQERSKMKKLLEHHPTRVMSFCDLSVRSDEEDEWDIMGYDKMTTLERCNHALLRASAMLLQTLHEKRSKIVVILSSDPDFSQRFTPDEGVRLLEMDGFLNFLYKDGAKGMSPESLQELQTRCEEAYKLRNTFVKGGKQGSEATMEYLSEDEVVAGLQNKSLVKGRLNVTKENPKEGYVLGTSSIGESSSSEASSYFIDQTLGYFNRALHQDIVVLKPLDKSQWGRPIGRRRLVHHRDDDDGETYVHGDVELSPPVPSARVVAIAEASRRQFVATLVDLPMNDENACIVVPMDIRIPKIRIRTNTWRRFVGNRLLVQIDGWEIGNNYPAGHCVDIIGPVADLETEIQCLLYENQLHLEPFSPAALACLPSLGNKWVVPQEEIDRRLDLRSTHRIFSVDPDGCQDIDDTMHARVLPNGDIEIGVHIADVTYFVPHNSPLDIEAQIRGTTFYLVDRRFDMLPSLLSSDLCSLHGGKDRLALSTIWTFSSDFKDVKSFWYGRSVIHNCQAMTYEQAHNILHDKAADDPSKPPPPPLTAGYPVNPANVESLKEDLGVLTRLARKLRRDREEIGGAVDLSSGDQGSELKFTLDDNNNPVKVTPKKQHEIHHTIAELMILANTWVAKTIHQKMPDRALLRVHRSAEETRFEDLKEVLKAGKIAFDGSSNVALADSLKKAEKTAKSGSLMALFQSLATRAMSEAQYVSTGQVAGQIGLSHYGLGLQKYTHFTSPIRRYADVIVHKQLLAEDTGRAEANRTSETKTRGLESLPSSKVISILGGEGLAGSEEEPETTAEYEHPRVITPSTSRDEHVDEENTLALYEPSQVSKICEGLNRQNRMAKLSSFECQSLFLSLYFKEHVETTKAVVTNLRSNGFWVYVPVFDMRGPVYLSDMNGNIQVDPSFFNLPEYAGQEPSLGFASSRRTRMFPGGRCDLLDSPERLEVVVPESTTTLRVHVLDVVTVRILSDDWDTRARVPPPRLHLLAGSPSKVTVPRQPTAQRTLTNKTNTQAQPMLQEKEMLHPSSLYQEIMNIPSPPVLVDVPLRSKGTLNSTEPSGAPSMPGRVIFGAFRNPDTHLAKQETAMAEASEAAKERRNQIMASQARNNEFNTSRQIERDATLRMQRLAASKRNARRAKAK